MLVSIIVYQKKEGYFQFESIIFLMKNFTFRILILEIR